MRKGDEERIAVWSDGQIHMLTTEEAHQAAREQRYNEDHLARRPDEQAAGRADHARSRRTR